VSTSTSTQIQHACNVFNANKRFRHYIKTRQLLGSSFFRKSTSANLLETYLDGRALAEELNHSLALSTPSRGNGITKINHVTKQQEMKAV